MANDTTEKEMLEKLGKWFEKPLKEGKNIEIRITKQGISVYETSKKLLVQENRRQ